MDLKELKKNKLLLGIIILVVLGILLIPALVVLLAGLLYLGIFNVSAPEVCTMPVGMACTEAHLLADGDKLEITLINGFQKPMVITQMSCSKKPSQLEDIQKTTMQVGQSKPFLITCNDINGKPINFEKDDTFSGNINLQYYFESEGPTAMRRVVGNIYAKAA